MTRLILATAAPVAGYVAAERTVSVLPAIAQAKLVAKASP
jgi:hypothetical protein